jgi:CRISPR-associated endonuclease/helicase Cas3
MQTRSSTIGASAGRLVLPPGSFWAKLSPREQPTEWHPLLAHSADVAAVLHRLLRPDSVLSERLARTLGAERLDESIAARLVYVAALHDFGKVNHGFQDQWKDRAARSPGHVQVVLASLALKSMRQAWTELLAPLGLPMFEAHELLRTAICHHGRPWDPPSSPNVPIWQADHSSGRDPLQAIRTLARHALGWSGLGAALPDPSLRLTPRFLHLFAGALTLADWIGSTAAAFPFAPQADEDPELYWQHAHERATHACARVGLTPQTRVCALDGARLLERVFPRVFGVERPAPMPKAVPTPLQLEAAQMPLLAPGGRVLIESETGSGKTEAALALYARLRASGRAGGLVFALPTRSTATAMHERVLSAVAAMYEPGDRPAIALAMGGEQARTETAEPLLRDEAITYPDAAERELVRWSSGSAKKFFAAEIVVGTLDQLLLGGLAVKHAHLRIAAFSRHLLVVDELHSYDRYMAEVLRSVLDMHGAAGGVAVLMSATLSDRERLRFGGQILFDEDEQTPLAEALVRPYPVLSVSATPGEPWTDIELRRSDGPAKPPLRWQLCAEDAGLEAAITAARAGARVCVLRNTVKGARATIARLLEAMGDPEARERMWRPSGSPHTPAYHSRYTLPDRKTLDRAVLDAFGRGQKVGDGRILVATQVAEQSLDVDFDVLITDLCPIDVLLQRLGRVWRHRERDDLRPAIARETQVWIIQPVEGLEPLLPRQHGGENGWGTVYEHLGFLELTRRTVAERAAVVVPDDNRALVESVYHADPLNVLRAESAAWATHFDAQLGRAVGREVTARGAMIRFDETYIANADRFSGDLTGAIRTRLGDDRVQVALPEPLFGCFDPAAAVFAVDLPYHMLHRAGVDIAEPRAVLRATDGVVTRFYVQGFEFGYGPQGWEW